MIVTISKDFPNIILTRTLMRDLIIASLALLSSGYGYLIQSYFPKQYKKVILLLLSGFLLIVLVKILFAISWTYSLYILIALPLGFILAHFHPLVYYNLFSFVLAGAFCLSSHSNQYSMLACLLLLLSSSQWIKERLKPENPLIFALLASISLLFYYALYLFVIHFPIINGLFVSLVATFSGVLLTRKLFILSLPFYFILFSLFSFIGYPDLYILTNKEQLIGHNLSDFSFRDQDTISNSDNYNNGLVMIETWHQYCGSCFASMSDLNKHFSSLGHKYKFKHYYAFVGENLPDSAIYEFKHLPPLTTNIIIDNNLKYYNTLEMQGAPYFNFYQNGKYLFSYSGYERNYIKRYQKLFSNIIEKYSK